MPSIDTLAVHAGNLSPRIEGAVVTPIFQTANYEQPDVLEYRDVPYVRLSNTPNHRVLAARLAALEGTEAAVVAGSGMAAISATLLALLSAGDHFLIQRNVYGGTATLVAQDLPRFGIHSTAVDPARPETWATALQPSTRVFYVEALSNPLLEVPALDEVVAFAKANGLLTVIDNTFLSPVNWRPALAGFDVVLHSATKYLNGHSDVAAGAVAGRSEPIQRIVDLLGHLGGHLDPHACGLLERGLKTLGLRVRRQNESASYIAKALADHPAVTRVLYPGLPDHPGHTRAAATFEGFGGMLSFETRDEATAARFLQRVRLAVHAASLGGVETLVVQPGRSSHLGMPQAEREALGISDRLIRLSVGIEDPADILDDLTQALS